jgi:hypothetical protein
MACTLSSLSCPEDLHEAVESHATILSDSCSAYGAICTGAFKTIRLQQRFKRLWSQSGHARTCRAVECRAAAVAPREGTLQLQSCALKGATALGKAAKLFAELISEGVEGRAWRPNQQLLLKAILCNASSWV